MVNIVVSLIKLQEQIRILHWQTRFYSRHKAFGEAYSQLQDLIDELVEVYQGKNDRLVFQHTTLDLLDIDDFKLTELLDSVLNTLHTELPAVVDPIRDTDILNIRDEIVGFINKFKYLLTLK